MKTFPPEALQGCSFEEFVDQYLRFREWLRGVSRSHVGREFRTLVRVRLDVLDDAAAVGAKSSHWAAVGAKDRAAAAVGDSRPLASCVTGRDGSAIGDKVQNVPASGGKTKQIQAFGCRIRCAIDKEAEMRKYIADERSTRTPWTDRQWRVNMNAIAV